MRIVLQSFWMSFSQLRRHKKFLKKNGQKFKFLLYTMVMEVINVLNIWRNIFTTISLCNQNSLVMFIKRFLKDQEWQIELISKKFSMNTKSHKKFKIVKVEAALTLLWHLMMIYMLLMLETLVRSAQRISAKWRWISVRIINQVKFQNLRELKLLVATFIRHIR